MATLDLTFQDIYKQVADYIGLGTSPAGDDLTKVQNIVYRAYRQFLYAVDPRTKSRHLWSFLRDTTDITTSADDYQYDLPADFDTKLGEPNFSDDSGYGPLTQTSADDIRQKNAISAVTSYPVQYAIVPKTNTAAAGTTWEIWLWPTPDGEYTITLPYLISPAKPSNTTDYILGGPKAGEVFLEMAMAIAESQEEDSQGVHAQLANTMLIEFMLSDSVDTPDNMGKILLNPNIILSPRGTAHWGTDSVYAD
jgi:hypothetical protein